MASYNDDFEGTPLYWESLPEKDFVKKWNSSYQPYKRPSNWFYRIAVILLVMASLFLAYVSYKQDKTIRLQRAMIHELVIYIEQGCTVPNDDRAEN